VPCRLHCLDPQDPHAVSQAFPRAIFIALAALAVVVTVLGHRLTRTETPGPWTDAWLEAAYLRNTRSPTMVNLRGPGDLFRVVVVGAGYAGVIAANRVLSTLARRVDTDQGKVEVTVVNPRPDFVQRIRLHEVAAGTTSTAALPLTDVLHPAARLRVGVVEHIDPLARTVHGPGLMLGYDCLVYAVGSRSGDGVPGSTAHAHQVADAGGAQALRRAVAGLRPGGTVVVGSRRAWGGGADNESPRRWTGCGSTSTRIAP
jgi:hypothetical protein